MTIDDLNREFAIVGMGNRMVVMQLAADGAIVELWDFDHFKKRLCKEFIKVRMEDGKVKTLPLADVWLKHRRGRQYDRLVYAVPGSVVQAGERDYNGWQGFTVEPKAGRWEQNRSHLLNVICSGNAEHFAWVMNWLAALAQLPGRHAWTAIVLRGGQGIGKGHFANNMVGRLFGPQQYLHILGSGQLTAEFNEHLSGKVYVYADESTWGGDPRAAAKLKGLVTEDTIPIHRKFLKMVDEPSMLHIVIASNNEWPIPIESGDRRFSVLDVSPEKKQNQHYFGQLLAELGDGGRAAMLADLLAWPIDEAMLRTPLATTAKAHVAQRSFSPHETWLQNWLVNLDGRWVDRVAKSFLYERYCAALPPHTTPLSAIAFGRFLRQSLGHTEQQPKWQEAKDDGPDGRLNVYVFHSLTSCRKGFDASFGISSDWPMDDGCPECPESSDSARPDSGQGLLEELE